MRIIKKLVILTFLLCFPLIMLATNKKVECATFGYPANKTAMGDLECGTDTEKCCVAKGSSGSDLSNPNHFLVGDRINIFIHDDSNDHSKGNGYINALVIEEFYLDIAGPNAIQFIEEDSQTNRHTFYLEWVDDVVN